MDYPVHPPTIVHSRADIAQLLADRRRALGMTCEGLDFHAGFSDRYTAKMEHGDKPSGRQGFHISPMAEVWLSALGLALVVMGEREASDIGAVRAAVRVVS